MLCARDPLQPDSHRTARAQQIIYRAGAAAPQICLIRSGWSFRFARLSDGRRQILSVLLPGDFFSVMSLFRRELPFSVQTLTTSEFCKFNRDDLIARLFRDQPAVDFLASLIAAETTRADDLVLDLGRRAADERIARLILDLMNRLSSLGLTRGPAFDFPLRQEHIADIVGLTPVHVSRVITMFRKARLIEIEQRVLTVIELEELKRIAGVD
jgi:CRP-like cAMP-binding protein